jgi:hypothetical protein
MTDDFFWGFVFPVGGGLLIAAAAMLYARWLGKH